jgi:hypothetical protein
MKRHPKLKDEVEFIFAGSPVVATITKIVGDKYKVFDGKYTYTVTKEMIEANKKK